MNKEDWSEEDIRASEIDTYSWEQSDTEIDEEDVEKANEILNDRKGNGGGPRSFYRQNLIENCSEKFDPDIYK